MGKNNLQEGCRRVKKNHDASINPVYSIWLYIFRIHVLNAHAYEISKLAYPHTGGVWWLNSYISNIYFFILITSIIFNQTCLHPTGGAWSSFSPGRGERWGRGSSGSRCVWRSLTSSNRRTGDWPRKWNKRWVSVCIV